MILLQLARIHRRVWIYNLIGEAVAFFSIASQLSNLLLLVMVVTELSEPRPLTQCLFASLVMLSVAVDIVWIRNMTRVLQ